MNYKDLINTIDRVEIFDESKQPDLTPEVLSVESTAHGYIITIASEEDPEFAFPEYAPWKEVGFGKWSVSVDELPDWAKDKA